MGGAMPKYYCDFCDAWLVHDSQGVRKQHNMGFKHLANVRAYYTCFLDNLAPGQLPPGVTVAPPEMARTAGPVAPLTGPTASQIGSRPAVPAPALVARAPAALDPAVLKAQAEAALKAIQARKPAPAAAASTAAAGPGASAAPPVSGGGVPGVLSASQPSGPGGSTGWRPGMPLPPGMPSAPRG